MKILFLSAWYPNRYDPMPGLFVKQHAEVVASQYDVAVLYVHPCDIVEKEIVCQNIKGVFTTVVYYPSGANYRWGNQIFVKAFLFLKAFYVGYKTILAGFGKPDLIHANILTRVGVVAWLLKIITSVPYVITEHWSRYLPSRNEYRGFLRKYFTRLVVRHSSGIATVSQALKTAMENKSLKHPNFAVIPNSVDMSRFIPALDWVKSSKKIFSHISCFDDAAKNISGILTAVDKLSRKRQDFELHIAGDGPDRAKIENQCNQLGLTGTFVFFEGLAEDHSLVEVYQKSMFTVLFSNYENMPVVIAESMACGVPVIATPVGGIPEILNKTNGLLVETKNTEKLSDAISWMLDHHADYDAGTIRTFAEVTFGQKAFFDAYQKFYSKAISE